MAGPYIPLPLVYLKAENHCRIRHRHYRNTVAGFLAFAVGRQDHLRMTLLKSYTFKDRSPHKVK